MSKTNKKEYENKMRNDLKPMRNASFLGVNDGNTMRNAISQFISHSIISLIYKLLSYHLWEHEKWIWKNICRSWIQQRLL